MLKRVVSISAVALLAIGFGWHSAQADHGGRAGTARGGDNGHNAVLQNENVQNTNINQNNNGENNRHDRDRGRNDQLNENELNNNQNEDLNQQGNEQQNEINEEQNEQDEISPANNAVISVVSVDRIRANLNQGQSTTITVRLISSNASAQNVSVAVQLFNSTDQLVGQNFLMHQTLAQNAIMNFQLTTSASLPAGNFRIATVVFNPNGTKLAEFTNLGTITIQ